MLSACICSPEPLLALQVAHLKMLSQAGVGAAWWSSPMRAGGDLPPCPYAAPSSGGGAALNPPFSPQNTPGPCLCLQASSVRRAFPVRAALAAEAPDPKLLDAQ